MVPAVVEQSMVQPSRAAVVWRRIADINDRDTLVETRGFHRGSPAMVARLERVGATFVLGYRTALYSGPEGPDVAFLADVGPEFRGFAAEGAAMGCAVADLLCLGGRHLDHWLARTDQRFTYLTHVGVGWAMARLPFSRHRLLRRLDPLHAWLAIDGLGFHDTYFHGQRVLAGWQRERQGYGVRAWHQGVGRALWFLAGGDMDRAIGLLEQHFRSGWHADLWAGLGLAVTYAGDSPIAALHQAHARAGPHAGHLGQGAVFGAAAHVRHGMVPEHCEAAVRVLAGMTAAEAATLAEETRSRLNPACSGDANPPYEKWRHAVRAGVKSPSLLRPEPQQQDPVA